MSFVYSCPRCGYGKNYISQMYAHFGRKNPCKPNVENIPFENIVDAFNNSLHEKETTDEKKYKCKYCSKSYVHSQSLCKHLQLHHSKPSTDGDTISREEYEISYKSLQDEIELLKKQKNESPDIKTTVHNTTNHNTTNNIFIINAFGSENIDYINEEYIAGLLKQPKQGIYNLIRQIHFNPGRPENHNVKITNKKLPYASVYTNNGWELDDKKKVINRIINKSKYIMDNVYDDKNASLEASTKRVFGKFQKKFDEDNKELKKDLQKTTEIQILNEQKVINNVY